MLRAFAPIESDRPEAIRGAARSVREKWLTLRPVHRGVTSSMPRTGGPEPKVCGRPGGSYATRGVKWESGKQAGIDAAQQVWIRFHLLSPGSRPAEGDPSGVVSRSRA